MKKRVLKWIAGLLLGHRRADCFRHGTPFDVIDAYRAVQIAIQLQRWHIEHGAYPSDASSIRAPADLWGLTYEVTADGSGYKLGGYRGAILEAAAR